MLQDADKTCQDLIDFVRERIPSLSAATPTAPAVGQPQIEEVKSEEIKDEEEQKLREHEPKMFWKFAVKAAYIKAQMLASCCEFAKPKRLIFFAETVLVKLLRKFTPEIFVAEEHRDDGIPASLSEKVLPDHYYSFRHRRVFAKLRATNYFVGEAERLYRQLLHDELRFYDLYDFTKFEEENPVVTLVSDGETAKD